MCGIAGFVGKGEEGDLKAMIRPLAHRGPNHEGFYFREGLGLGHRRLSIIDLSQAAHQPMWDEKGEVVIIFNGEIYNFKSLRHELEQLGKRFRSNSDTEVILLGFELWGLGIFARLSGMFAIALYDKGTEQLILARDPMGKKPLYWAKFGQVFLFGSELKALLAHSSFKKEIDQRSLAEYLINECVQTPRSIWKNVFKLEPGTVLVYEGHMVQKETFWRPNYILEDIPLPEAMLKLDNLLAEATTKRLVADVPLGVFLSGGIDSSTVAYYASRTSSRKIKTFSIGFNEKSFDESSYARQVANNLKTDHHEQFVSAQDMLEVVPLISEIFDEPVADASVIPTYLLSKFTKKSVTVALGGDGGDELFAGYSTFIADQFQALFPVIQGLGSIALTFLSAGDSYFSLDFKIRKFLDGAEYKGVQRHARWFSSFQPEDLSHILLPKGNPLYYKGFPFGETGETTAGSVQEFYLRRYLMDQVLVKVDRASMRNALEVRAPFLDKQVVEFANALPYRYKVRGLTTKYILKKLMQDKLPAEIVWRKKQGFAVPLSRWPKTDLRALCEELLSRERIVREGIFNIDFIDRLKKDHFESRVNNSKKLWTLMVFQLWRDRWLS